jgi:hypothetical protein
MNLPTYPVLPATVPPTSEKPDPVATSVAKPNAFSKPGTMKGDNKGTRFRPLSAKRGPGRQRIRKRDPRVVRFY